MVDLRFAADASVNQALIILPRFGNDGKLQRVSGQGRYVIVRVKLVQFREEKRWVSSCSDSTSWGGPTSACALDDTCRRKNGYLCDRPDMSYWEVFGDEPALCCHGRMALGYLEALSPSQLRTASADISEKTRFSHNEGEGGEGAVSWRILERTVHWNQERCAVHDNPRTNQDSQQGRERLGTALSPVVLTPPPPLCDRRTTVALAQKISGGIVEEDAARSAGFIEGGGVDLFSSLGLLYKGEATRNQEVFRCMTCTSQVNSCWHVKATSAAPGMSSGVGKAMDRQGVEDMIDSWCTGGAALARHSLSRSTIPENRRDTPAGLSINDRVTHGLGSDAANGGIRGRAGRMKVLGVEVEGLVWYAGCDGVDITLLDAPGQGGVIEEGKTYTTDGATVNCPHCGDDCNVTWQATRVWHSQAGGFPAVLLLAEGRCGGQCKSTWLETNDLGILRWTSYVAYAWEFLDGYWSGCLTLGQTFSGFWNTVVDRVTLSQTTLPRETEDLLRGSKERQQWQHAALAYVILMDCDYEGTISCCCPAREGVPRVLCVDGKLISMQSRRAHFVKPHMVYTKKEDWDKIPATRANDRKLVTSIECRRLLKALGSEEVRHRPLLPTCCTPSPRTKQ